MLHLFGILLPLSGALILAARALRAWIRNEGLLRNLAEGAVAAVAVLAFLILVGRWARSIFFPSPRSR